MWLGEVPCPGEVSVKGNWLNGCVAARDTAVCTFADVHMVLDPVQLKKCMKCLPRASF